jgi:hypothetical protein
VGYIAGTGEYKILVGKSEGKHSIGRPGRRGTLKKQDGKAWNGLK